MNMLVCVKQVPDTTEIKIDPVTNTLIRAGVPSILNPFDGYALEAAARIKDADPSAKIVVLSMGPEQAKAVLKESLGYRGRQGVSGQRPGLWWFRHPGHQLHHQRDHQEGGGAGRQV